MALFKISLVFVLVFYGIASSTAQDLELLDQELNIWAPEDPEAVDEAGLALQTLCNNYNFIVDGRQLDCSNVLLTARSKDAEYVHSISKRDAEVPEEGSGGNGPVLESEPNLQNETKKSEEALDTGSIISPDGEPSPVQPREDQVNDTGIVKSLEGSQNADVTSEASENTANSEATTKVETEEKPLDISEDKVEEPVPEDNKNGTVKSEISNFEDNGSPTKENKDKQEGLIPENEDNKDGVGDVKKQTKEDSEAAAAEKEAVPVKTTSDKQNSPVEKVLASDLAEVNSNHTKEDIIEEQSANAALLKPIPETFSSGVEVSESEKAIKKLAGKANEEVQKDSNAPTTSESTVQRGSKSTAVLLVLLVVVLVIGAAIFIRKYTGSKNKNKETVTTNGKNGDIEQGQELKPLMKDGVKQSPVKEYSENSKETK